MSFFHSCSVSYSYVFFTVCVYWGIIYIVKFTLIGIQLDEFWQRYMPTTTTKIYNIFITTESSLLVLLLSVFPFFPSYQFDFCSTSFVFYRLVTILGPRHTEAIRSSPCKGRILSKGENGLVNRLLPHGKYYFWSFRIRIKLY